MAEIDFRKEVEARKDDLLKDMTAWIKIPSVTGTPEAKEALTHGLELGKKMGFDTESFHDNTSGHIVMKGKEDAYVGILGHVDVVPVDPSEWDDDPFSGKVDDKFIYGRGTQDDKGPSLMALYALKIIKDLGLPFTKTVKMILGTQEEGGDWSDIENYFKTNPAPECGFTPDADFPLIYAEKHILRMDVEGETNFEFVKSFKAGNAVNSVPSEAVLELNMAPEVAATKAEHFSCPEGTSVSAEGNVITFKGVAAHAKDAHLGKSAAFAMIKFINSLEKNELLQKMDARHSNDPFCQKTGWVCEAEDGKLTHNLGIFNFEDGKFIARNDFRLPNKFSLDELQKKFTTLWGTDYKVTCADKTKGLFKSKTDPLVVTLEKAFRDVTGDMDTPLKTTGGGTYAKAAPNTVAFGPLFSHDEPTLHQKNERFAIASILDGVEIYCKAIYNLMK